MGSIFVIPMEAMLGLQSIIVKLLRGLKYLRFLFDPAHVYKILNQQIIYLPWTLFGQGISVIVNCELVVTHLERIHHLINWKWWLLIEIKQILL